MKKLALLLVLAAFCWSSQGIPAQRLGSTSGEIQKELFRGKLGALDFTDLEINILTEDYVYVLGRWKLTGQDLSSVFLR